MRLIDDNTSVLDSLRHRDLKKMERLEKGIRKNITTIKNKVYEIGKLLFEAKKTLPHGQFQRWIEETFGHELPYSTAAAFKDIYDHFNDQPAMVKHIPISILLLLKQKEFPEEILKMIEADPGGFAKVVDIEQFKKTYAGFKKGKKSVEDFFTYRKFVLDRFFADESCEQLLRKYENTKRAMRWFYEMDKVIDEVEYFSNHYGQEYRVPDDYLPAFIDYYNNEMDIRIDRLQKAKAAFNAVPKPPLKSSWDQDSGMPPSLRNRLQKANDIFVQLSP
jgi:hypothetical protein